MALNDVTIGFDLAQILGGDFDSRRTKAYVTTNVANGTLMDTSTGETRLGDQAVTINADGTGEFTTWGVGAAGNPASWQTTLVVDYPRTGQNDRKVRSFGPYTLEDANDGDNITDLEDEQAIPAEYQTAFTEQAQAYLDAQAEIAGIDDTDSAVAALIEDELVGPLTNAALSASIEEVGGAMFAPAVVFQGAGIDLTGATDSTAALQALYAAGIAAGARRFVGVPGATYKITIADSAWLFEITDDHVTIDFSHSALDNSATSYTADTVTPIFKLDAANDTTILVGEYLGYTLPTPASHLGYRGATLVYAINGCDGVKVDAKITNARYGVISGNYADASKGLCRNFEIRLQTSFCGYPVALYLADNIHLDIDADDIHRGAYLAGCNNVRGVVRWKNQYIGDIVVLITDALTGGTDAVAQVAPPANPTTSRGSTDIELTSIDKGSTIMQNSTMCAGIALSRVDACQFRNIKFKVQSKSTDSISRYVGGFIITSGAKTIWNRYAFNWESTVVLDNIEVSGVADQSAMTLSGNAASGGFYVATYDTSTSHAATVRNLKIKDFVHLPSSGNTRSNYIQSPGCQATVLDNVYAPGVDLGAYTGASLGEITLRDSKVKELVTAGSTITMIRSTAVSMDATTAPKCFDSLIHGAGGINGIFKHVYLTLSGASTSWSAAIPQGAIVKGVQSRVTTAITGASSFQIGVSGATDRYATFVSTPAGTTTSNRFWVASESTLSRVYGSATDIVVTAQGSNFTGGVLHLVLIYELPSNLSS